MPGADVMMHSCGLQAVLEERYAVHVQRGGSPGSATSCPEAKKGNTAAVRIKKENRQRIRLGGWGGKKRKQPLSELEQGTIKLYATHTP